MTNLTKNQIRVLELYHQHIDATNLLAGNRMKSAHTLGVQVEEFGKLYEQYKKENNLN